jgi:hypothetical protein
MTTTSPMTMTPEFQARAMVQVARMDAEGQEAVTRDLLALINSKNELLAAAKRVSQYIGEHTTGLGPATTAECASILRSAIARAEGK